jgi:hypothetical protein
MAILGLGFLVGMLAEPITFDVWRADPIEVIPATLVVSNLVVPIVMVVLALQAWKRLTPRSKVSRATTKVRSILPWAGLLLIVGEMVVALSLSPRFDFVTIATLFYVVSTGLVGAFVAYRLPSHPIGWLLLLASFSYMTGGFAVTYVELALARPGSVPFIPLLVWLGDLSFGLGVGISATFVLLLFPTGHLPSPRWKPVAWAAAIGLFALLLGVALSPELFEGMPMENPIALAGSSGLLAALEGGGFYLFMLAVVGSVASLVLRFLRSDEVVRQQLKWVALSVVILGLGLVGMLVWELANGTAEVSDDLENLVITLSLSLVPVAIGIAITRYRLYDINRIISRTVTYALVVGLLAAVFFGLVTALAGLLSPDQPLVVAASTLAVFALFSPLRKRVQSGVDKRFNRSRYNAERVIETFTGTLRDRVDPDGVVDGWVGVVSETMHPSKVGAWVRE